MTKIVRVNEGDYRVGVQPGGTITLDTGWQTGNVEVTGNLIVRGDYTTVESETMVVKDNIIVLNQGDSGPGITLNQSGIEIVRTNGPKLDPGEQNDGNIFIVFDETVDHLNPATNENEYGTLIFKANGGRLIGIRTNSINTNGGDLALINSGTGIITVRNTSAYEQNVLDYTDWASLSGPIQLTDDPDAIPNTQALADYVESQLYFFDDYAISTGDTKVECFDTSEGDAASKITFEVDGVEKGQFNVNGLNVDNIRLLSNTISNTSVGNNLILTATNKNIQVGGYLNLQDQVSDPLSAGGYNKLYSKSTSGPGDTGIYFVNTRDSNELVSKKRALLFSMVF
jgi:hypothetical protein